MRLRDYPFLSRRVITFNLDDFGVDPSTTKTVVDPDVPVVHIASGNDPDLLYYRKPICPQCGACNVVRNGTFIRTLETGSSLRVQRYRCKDCLYSFEARPPNHGYGNHISDDTKKESIRGRVKTSLRKASEFFSLIGNIAISHETIRKNVPDIPTGRMESSGFFVYDEQYAHIDGIQKSRAILKDTKNRNFFEDILDDLGEATLIDFFVRALSSFTLSDHVYVTTDGYHYDSILKEAAARLSIRIERQRCLFHIEKDIAHKISMAGKDNSLEGAKKLIKFMFFQNDENLRKLGNNRKAVERLIEGKNESGVVEIMLQKIHSLYGGDEIISRFLEFIRSHRKQVFLYLKNSEVEKTSDKAEQHFSIMSWLFKHRFKTKQGLLRTSYGYHYYLSTGN